MQTTMREANDRGFECLLAEDATESYFPEFKMAAIDMFRAQGAIVEPVKLMPMVRDGCYAASSA